MESDGEAEVAHSENRTAPRRQPDLWEDLNAKRQRHPDLRENLNACRREYPVRVEPDNQDPVQAQIEDLKRMVSRMARKQGHDSDSEEDEEEPCAPHIVEAPLP